VFINEIGMQRYEKKMRKPNFKAVFLNLYVSKSKGF
jgi:hypothetical protein